MALLSVEQNPPCPVYFAGWSSDTYTLGRHGWDVAYQQDHYRGKRELLLYHKETGLKALAVGDGGFFELSRSYRDCDIPQFNVVRMATEMRVRYDNSGPVMFAGMNWVNTVPAIVRVEECDVMSLPLFQKLGAPVAESLIVEPASVAQLLDQIRKMQSPEQAAIRARNRSREAMNEKPLIHATLMSFDKSA